MEPCIGKGCMEDPWAMEDMYLDLKVQPITGLQERLKCGETDANDSRSQFTLPTRTTHFHNSLYRHERLTFTIHFPDTNDLFFTASAIPANVYSHTNTNMPGALLSPVRPATHLARHCGCHPTRADPSSASHSHQAYERYDTKSGCQSCPIRGYPAVIVTL